MNWKTFIAVFICFYLSLMLHDCARYVIEDVIQQHARGIKCGPVF